MYDCAGWRFSRGVRDMPTKNRNQRDRGTGRQPQEGPFRGRGGTPTPGGERRAGDGAPLDLLELDPEADDGQELLEFESDRQLQAVIKVVGVGGGGGNAINTMVRSSLGGVEFMAANTDAQALKHNLASTKIQLGTELTRGLGCGADPEKGKAAALEDRDRLRDMLIGADMVFVTAGMGGGTGTGAAPVVAEVAREVGALTVAVVTKPFPFEGRVRSKQADRGLEELHRVVDTLITIPNNRLLALAGKSTAIKDAFVLADDVLLNAVRGISDLITTHGLINLDFADVRTIMNEMGMALMGTGVASGESRALEAAQAAISSPLLEDLSIEGARGVLINVTGGDDMMLHEVDEASRLIQEAAHEEANIIFGAVVSEDVAPGELRVTVIATGLEDDHLGGGRRDRAVHTRELGTVHVVGPSPAPLDGGLPAAEQRQPRSTARETAEPVEPGRPSEPEQPVDWVSPFADEEEVPAFVRRNEGWQGDEEDRDVPAFLRRQAD